MSPARRFSTSPAVAYVVAALFFVALGTWLVIDFWKERERTLAETARVAEHQSQLMITLFGSTFSGADYVLRDVMGHINNRGQMTLPASQWDDMLAAKLKTANGLADMVLLDGECRFVAVANNKSLIGTQSRQRFCRAGGHSAAGHMHIQYMPAENSANGKPVVLLSRVIGHEHGQLLAGVTAVMELDHAQRWIEGFKVSAQDVYTIIDSDGVVIARNPKAPDGPVKLSHGTLGLPSFDQIAGTITFTAYSPLDGLERVVGVTRSGEFPFIAMVGYDKSRALLGWQQRVWQFAFGYVVLVILVFVLIRAQLKASQLNVKMFRMATTDALTGIANRLQVFELGERDVQLAQRHSKPLSVLVIDIDLFKSVNDRWGHPVGDRVIRHTAEVIRSALRTSDVAGRVGGEEFIAILPETDAEGARSVAERLRISIEKSERVTTPDGQVVRYTISVGVAQIRLGDTCFESLFQRADGALYQAKEGGRNRVVVEGDLVVVHKDHQGVSISPADGFPAVAPAVGLVQGQV